MLIVFRKYVRERGKVKKSAGEILACNEVKYCYLILISKAFRS